VTIDYLPLAVRGYGIRPRPSTDDTEKPTSKKRRRPGASPPVRHLLVFDTETTTDPTQRLNFGFSKLCKLNADGSVRCVEERAFHADDLPERDADGFATLKGYVEAPGRYAETMWPGSGDRYIRLMSISEWLEQVFWHYAYKKGMTVVGFNLPFDLSRVACGAGKSRDTKDHLDMAGGFSLRMFAHAGRDNQYRSQVAIKNMGSRGSLMTFTHPKEVDGGVTKHRGQFLDCSTLAFALADFRGSLDAACRRWDTEHRKLDPGEHGTITDEYVDYARGDVRVATELVEKLLAEHRSHPVDLQATKAYSPASMAKAYLKAFGIRPVLERQPDFPPEVIGWAVSAFYGGRAECRIRKTVVPVTLCDFTSMYPTVDALMGLWGLLTARTVEVVDATDEVQRFLDEATVPTMLDPASWPSLVGVARVVADGDVLPVRASYTPAEATKLNIGLNHLHARTPLGEVVPLWFTIADLVASKLLTGRAPVIERAVRFVGRGRQRGLRPVALAGKVTVDPRTEDFFTKVVEARAKVKGDPSGPGPFLKVLANAGSYGIFAEMIRKELPAGETEDVEVHGRADGPFTSAMNSPEDLGAFCFPPIAACITGAARLMLAIAERMVTDAGGAWAFCDTDSMAIVSSETGGLVPCEGGSHRTDDGKPAVLALSYDQVDAIRARFDALNLYDPDAVPTMLKAEARGDCWAISAKRYALHRREGDRVSLTVNEPDGTPVVRFSEHGLGHLLNPLDSDDLGTPEGEGITAAHRARTARPPRKDFVADLWRWIIATDAYGLDVAEPAWLDRMAVTRVPVSAPSLLKPFATLNAGRPYAEQVKPYNFLLGVPIRDFPPGVDPQRFRLIAPYNTDPASWPDAGWVNRYDRHATRYQVSTEPSGDEADRTRPTDATPYTVGVYSLRAVVDSFRSLPEGKAAAEDGTVCSAGTLGWLSRRHVGVDSVTHIGKEMNDLESRTAGVVAEADALADYGDPDGDGRLGLVLRVLDGLTATEIAERSGLGLEHHRASPSHSASER